MKRRGFLTIFGAAAATPFLPMSAASAPVAATFNRYTYGLAVFHARTRAHISARGLAHCLKVTMPQAEAMIGQMAHEGLVNPILGASNGSVRAVSNILRPDTWGLETAARQARSAQRQARLQSQSERTTTTGADLSRFITHLRQLCVDQGMTLHPRCAS